MHPSEPAIPDFSLIEKFIYHSKPKAGDSFDSKKLSILDGPFLSAFLPSSDRNDVSLVMNALSNLSTLEASLTISLRIVQGSIHLVRSQLLPVGQPRGIMSLPFEIIANIFEYVLLSDINAPACLSLVSKSFRATVLNMPQLWTRLSDKISPEHYLKRSRSRGLDIDIKLPSLDNAQMFLHYAKKHASRWKSFSFHGYIHSHFLRDLRQILLGKSFSALETLRITYAHNLGYVDRDAIEDSQVLGDVFRTWNMPVLRRLEFTDLVPVLQATSLTSIRFKLSIDDEDDTEYDLQTIANCLGSSSCLKELSIEIDKLKRFSNAEHASVDLPLLEKLDVTTLSCLNQSVEELAGLLTSTRNVEEFTLRIEALDNEELKQQLEIFFPRNKIYWPHLNTLDLTVEKFYADGSRDGSFSPLKNVFARLPKIRHLYIDAYDVVFPDAIALHEHARGQSSYPPLQTLSLRPCKHLKTSFILGMRDIINAPGFEKIEIHDCPLVDAQAVREIMPAGKIFNWRK